MSLATIPQLGGETTTVILLVLLILAFIVAFKVMKMVMETVMISVLSGVFYISMVFLFNLSFSLENLLFYSFSGASLYMLYSFLASAFGIAEKLIKIPYHALRLGLKPLKSFYSRIKEKGKLKKIKKKMEKKSSEREKNTKEVVLDKVKKED